MTRRAIMLSLLALLACTPSGTAQMIMPQAGFHQAKQLGRFPLTTNDRVWNMVFSPDGKDLITVSDQVIRYRWRSPGGQRALWWPRENETMMHAIFSPNVKMFARLENGPGVHIHDTTSGKLIKTLKGRAERGTSGAWGPHGKIFAAGGKGEVFLWNVETGKLLKRIPHGRSTVVTLGISPDGLSLVAGNQDQDGDEGHLSVYRINGDSVPRVLEQGKGQDGRMALVFSPDGKTIAGPSAFDRRSMFCIWNAETGKVIHSYPGHYNGGIYSSDGKWVIACGLNNIQVWDVRTGDEVFKYQGEGINTHVWSLAISSKGDVLAAGIENSIRFWDTRSWKTINPSDTHHTAVRSVVFSPDGRYLVSGSKRGRVILWDWKTKSVVWVNDQLSHLAPRTAGEEGGSSRNCSWGVQDLSMSPDGSLIAVNALCGGWKPHRVTDPKKYHIIDPKSGKVAVSFGKGHATRGNVLVRKDNKTAYTGSYDGSIHAWDIRDGRLIRKIGMSPVRSSGDKTITSLAFAPDSEARIIWSGSPQGLGVRRLGDGKDVRFFKGGSDVRNSGIQVSANNDWLVSGRTLWRLPRGEVAKPARRGHSFQKTGLPHPSGLISVATLAGQAVLIDMLTGKPMREIDFGPGDILSITFSPDGKSLVAAGQFGIKHIDFTQLVRFKGLEKATLGQLWAFMGGADAWFAFQAAWALGDHKNGLSFLGEKLTPAQKPVPSEVSRLKISMQDANGDVAASAARLLLDTGVELSEEEIESLRRPSPGDNPHYHARIPGHIPIPGVDYQPRLGPVPELLPLSQRLRTSRAVMLLEEDGSDIAIGILKKLAGGYASSPLTHEAKWAIRRLENRKN